MTPPDLTPSKEGSLPRTKPPGTGGRLAAWVVDSSPPLDSVGKELAQVNHNIQQLSKILEQIEAMPTTDIELGSITAIGEGSYNSSTIAGVMNYEFGHEVLLYVSVVVVGVNTMTIQALSQFSIW
uniref:Uncharacterized protein n=1 Tax=Timema poppense TaxID=170557 RepID=A0A7R9DR89_TIMPO|nr:unnamed protein product [Timema poppensis]